MNAKRSLERSMSCCLLAWGCAGAGDAGGQAPTPGVPLVAAQAEPAGSLSSAEIEQLAYDFSHAEPQPEQQGDSLAPLRRLSAEDLRRFRVALATLKPLEGLAREMFDAYTDVLYEHRVFMLDAGPELMEEAVRRAFAKHSHEWGPDVVERAVQHVSSEQIPATFRQAQRSE